MEGNRWDRESLVIDSCLLKWIQYLSPRVTDIILNPDIYNG